MSRLIKLQLRNLYHNKMFFICLAIMILTSPVLAFFVSRTISDESLMVFPQIMTFLSGEVGFVAAIFIALFCCYDFSDGTTKNIIGRGYSRTQLLCSKYIVSLIGLFSMYVINVLVIFALFLKNGIGYESDMLYPLINSFAGIIANTIFFATMSFLLEKNGMAIIACLFVPIIVPMLLSLVDIKLHLNISRFWLANVSDKFVADPTLANLGLSILFYGIYCIIFIAAGILLLQKKEIK